jgi:uncharacterized RDD family membrane protein YckC
MPVGVVLAPAGRRLGGFLLSFPLFIATLGVGIVWALIVAKDGTTPSKQVLKMRVIEIDNQEPARWWRMAGRYVGKFIIWWLLYLIGWLLSGWLLFDKRRQELWDKMANTIVVHDPRGLLRDLPR